MIPVTAIEGVATFIDVDEISAIESTPETVIVLADGRRMLSADSADTLVRRIARERARRMARSIEPSRDRGGQG